MRPRDEHGPIIFEGGSLIYMDDARAAYQLEFSFETYLDTSDTYQEVELNALPELEGADIDVDCIDPSTTKGEPDGILEGHIEVNTYER